MLSPQYALARATAILNSQKKSTPKVRKGRKAKTAAAPEPAKEQ